jgi:hypothetical protein
MKKIPADQSSNNIKVAIRLRPLLQDEADQGFNHIGKRMDIDKNII